MSEVRGAIVGLEERVGALTAEEQERFRRIYHVTVVDGRLVLPAEMRQWAAQQFGSAEAVEQQRVVKVTNLITLEGALFNSLRSSRPMLVQSCTDDTTIQAEVADCSFCRPLQGTPEDVFGRVQGKYCVTASNVAKIDGFHGLVVFNEHHPLRFDAERLFDYFETGLKWARRAHSTDKSARYVYLLWNCLWRSGASIVHGHFQVTLGRGMHYARVEDVRRAALLYRIGHGTNYWDDLYAVHESLGLATQVGDVRVLAHLTPTKEREVILMAERPTEQLINTTHNALRCLIDDFSVQSFNLAFWMRPIDSVPEDWSGFPTMIRIIDRGPLDNRTSDIGTMELYGSSVISSDPFDLAQVLKRRVQ